MNPGVRLTEPEGVRAGEGRTRAPSSSRPVRLLALRRWAYGWSALLVVLFAFAVAGSGEFADVGAPLVLFGLFAWQALFATPRLLWGAR